MGIKRQNEHYCQSFQSSKATVKCPPWHSQNSFYHHNINLKMSLFLQYINRKSHASSDFRERKYEKKKKITGKGGTKWAATQEFYVPLQKTKSERNANLLQRQDKIFSFKISEKRREYCLHSKLTISVKTWKRLKNFAITNTAITINAFISTRSMVLMGWWAVRKVEPIPLQ